MPTLHPDLRGTLEKTVCDARDIAETGARAALEALAVGEAEPYKHLTPNQRDFRNRLRARGRQLGDLRDERKGTQEITRLVRQCAYEYWHRMLFAKFLAENQLLMHPEGVAVSLEECEELAAEEGIDAWTLASRYAARMLPQIFRPDDPLLQLTFALEHKQALEKLLAALPSEVFTASDSLGWVYQFWQAKRKKEVNDSGDKIGADELPAVTQLFTEDYMVDFLLQNTLGAWWVGHHSTEPLPVEMPYLRFVEDSHPPKTGEGEPETSPPHHPITLPPIHPSTHPPSHPTPASGTFPGWPKTAKELRILDPCCGSGHFLVAEFNLLVPMRMQEEGLSAQAACDAVLWENLYGLEIDERCTQIAAFALAMAAWTYPEAGGYRQLPKLNIACSGIAISAKREDWLALAGDDVRLQQGMRKLYHLFENAPTFGSLINPPMSLNLPILEATYEELEPIVKIALAKDRQNYSASELGIAAQGIAVAAKMLAKKYHAVITNVPYLGRGDHDEILKEFIGDSYSSSKASLATAFIERCQIFCEEGGIYGIVAPQNWMYQDRYSEFRTETIKLRTWRFVARLGTNAFETISGEVVNVALYIFQNLSPTQENLIYSVDSTKCETPAKKAVSLRQLNIDSVKQENQLRDSKNIIKLKSSSIETTLGDYVNGHHGQGSFDEACFRRFFWEFDYIDESIWVLQQGTTEETTDYGGCHYLFRWENGRGMLYELMQVKKKAGYSSGKWKAGVNIWGKTGISISKMGTLKASLYPGHSFDASVSVLIPKDENYFKAVWAFCKSPEFDPAVRQVNQNVSVDKGYILRTSFDFDFWQDVAESMEEIPTPFSNDVTQWLFAGNLSQSNKSLHAAIACLLGYSWPQEQNNSQFENLIDKDGIVCIPAIRGEQPASERLRELLSKAFGDKWSPTKQREILEQIGSKASNFDEWIKNEFFENHCNVFQNRPFIWHIWDGLKDGFAALVNYHKLDYKCLETLAYTYLGDWIREQQAAAKAGTSGADNKLLKAKQLQDKLALILAGEPPYDIFVRWKPLEQQPIGWHPDLNDGVRLNIRPFMKAGVLRKNPNIKWNKDRGKNPPDSPWGEERLNDIHLTLEEKRQAQEATQLSTGL